MHKHTKLILRTLLIVVLTFSVTSIYETEIFTVTAEATAKAPAVKSTKKTLYAGYKTYKVAFRNLSSKASITYKSSNSKIAKVSSKGTVTPVAKGTATITATVKQNSKTYYLKVKITVKNPYVRLTQETDYMNIDDTYLFKAKVYGMKDKIVWSVSDETIAIINQGGKLTALTSGTVTVYAKAGGKTTNYEVTIGNNRIGTFSNDITCYDEMTVWISTINKYDNESFEITTGSGKAEVFEFETGEFVNDRFPIKIIPKSKGTDSLIITSLEDTDQLHIKVTVVDKPTHRVELSAKEIYEKCGPATVEILATSSTWGESLGSGFFIRDGIIVTNYHVIEGSEEIQITTQDKEIYEVKSIIGFDEYLDLAILSINSKNESIEMSQTDAVVGEDVYALGSPFGLTGTLSDGMVSTSSREIDGVDYIQITASISPGNSGGPLLNVYGEVIGINTMYYEDGQNLNFAININELQKVYTNRPMTIAEYYDYYLYWIDNEDEYNYIFEDPSVSQSIDRCQTVEPLIGVVGSITQTETGDYYRFRMAESGLFVGVMASKDIMGFSNTYFSLYDSDFNLISIATDYSEELYQYINLYLQTGDYYLHVASVTGYVAEEMPYVIMVEY